MKTIPNAASLSMELSFFHSYCQPHYSNRKKLMWLSIGGGIVAHLTVGAFLTVTATYLSLIMIYAFVGYIILQLYTNDDREKVLKLIFYNTLLLNTVLWYFSIICTNTDWFVPPSYYLSIISVNSCKMGYPIKNLIFQALSSRDSLSRQEVITFTLQI